MEIRYPEYFWVKYYNDNSVHLRIISVCVKKYQQPATQSTLWRYTHLVAHALIGFMCLALRKGTVRTNTRDGTQCHEQSIGDAFSESPMGKAQELLAINQSGSETITNFRSTLLEAPG
jgi:hypothetical protein